MSLPFVSARGNRGGTFAAGPAAPAAEGATPVTDESDLAHWYKFDEGEGTNAADSVGSGDLTLYNSPAWETSTVRDGNAIDFDGSNDYLSNGLGDIPLLSNYTVCTWVRFDATAAAYQTLWNFTYSITNTHFSILGAVGGANINFYHRKADGGLKNLWISSSDIGGTGAGFVTDQWYHIAMVWDGTAETLAAYVNAVEEKTATGATGLKDSVGGGLQLRVGHYNSIWYVNGIIDDFRVYSTALSAEKIADIYNSGTGDY